MSGTRIRGERGGLSVVPAGRLAAFLGAALVLLAPGARAQEEPPDLPRPQDKGAFFFEVTSQYLAFSAGDLDGSLVIGNADQVFAVPKVKPSLGFGIGLGRRFRSGVWAISYLVSGHDASMRTGDTTCVSRLLQVNSRTFLIRSSRLKPFVHVGLNFPWLRVRNGVAADDRRRHDAAYLGVGANLGAGLLSPISSRMFFSASLVYRFFGYLYAKGPVKGIDVTDLFDDVDGPRHSRYLRAPGIALELSIGYEL